MAKTKEQLLNILDQFQLTEKVVSAEPFGNGHINDTLKVTNEKGEIKYVLQRINHLIFTQMWICCRTISRLLLRISVRNWKKKVKMILTAKS